MEEQLNYLKFYEFFGIRFTGKSGNNAFADCPFTGTKGKFYVNENTGQWDAKSAIKSGNIYSFLEHFYKLALEQTTYVDLQTLATHRGLPPSAFLNEVAKNPLDGKFLIPAKSAGGKVTGITAYSTVGKGKPFKAPLLKVQIGGLDKLTSDMLTPVYVCEGEWDYFALKWLHEKAGIKSVVLCMPGAGIFKEEWASHFEGRPVNVCYDNDEAGRKGEKRISGFVAGSAFKMQYFKWPDTTPEEYDVRDFIRVSFDNIFTATDHEIHACVSAFEAHLDPQSYYERIESASSSTDASANLPPIKYPELEKVYGKWLKMNNFDPLAIMFGTVFANKFQGDPVWTFIISAPGGSKTELLMTLNKSPLVETVTTLTPASMVSGMRSSDGADHSILKKLNERMLVIKDFTTILSGNPIARDEVFGLLRDIYDGYVEKYFVFGKKSYSSHFGILAGVTPIIDSHSGSFSQLGERFIKYRLEAADVEETEKQRIRRVLRNINTESNMREEMQVAAARMLNKKLPDTLPDFKSEKVVDCIMELAMFTSRMCGSVPKNQYTGEQMTKPITSVGTRISKQFMKLAIGIAIYYDHDVVGEEELRLLRIVARDTCPDRTESLIKAIYLEGNNFELDYEWLQTKTGLSLPTIQKMTQDLLSLKLLTKTRGMDRVKTFFALTPSFRDMITRTGIYTQEIKPAKPRIRIRPAGAGR